MSVRAIETRSGAMFHIEGKTAVAVAEAAFAHVKSTIPDPRDPRYEATAFATDYIRGGKHLGACGPIDTTIPSPQVEGGRRDVAITLQEPFCVVEMTVDSTPEACEATANLLDAMTWRDSERKTLPSEVVASEQVSRPSTQTTNEAFEVTQKPTHRTIARRTLPRE